MARTSAKDKLHTERNTTDSLYESAPIAVTPQTSAPNLVTSENKIAAINDSSLIRKTYYYTNDLIKAISVVAALQGKDKSQLVREILLDSDLIKEYIEKIKTL